MKYRILLVLLLANSIGIAQQNKSVTTKPKATTPPITDTFANNILASAASFLRVVENPKKNVYYFMADLRETNSDGEAVYSAPFPLPGFTANVRKVSTDRSAGQTEWIWSARFIEAPRGQKTELIKTLMKRADSLLHFFDNRLKVYTIDKAGVLRVNDNLNRTWMPTEYAEITIYFRKASYNTEQQAYDSLVSLYKPLLVQPNLAEECTGKLTNAFKVEGIPNERVKAFYLGYIKEVADKNINAAFKIMVNTPYFIKPEELVAQLSESQKAEIRTIATKVVDDFYNKQRQNANGGETVATQQKKIEAEKQVNKCDKLKNEHDAYKYKKGLTVIGYLNNLSTIGIITNIDCANEKVSISIPSNTYNGTTRAADISFATFRFWNKHTKQYYRCSRCGGEGGENQTKTETKTKELPFGYFDGITTTVTKTKTTTFWVQCYKCFGTGLALEDDKDVWNKGN